VVDDGSTDGTPELLEPYRARATILLKPNGGQASAINAGFEASTGAIVMFLDGDDTLDPEALSTILAAWRPGTVRVSCPLRVVDPGGAPIGRRLQPESCDGFDRGAIFRHPELAPHVSTSGNAFTRAVLERILPMPAEEWRQAPDIYLNVMSALVGPVQVMPEPLASYRIHPLSVTINWPGSLALLRDRTLLYGRLEAQARRLGLAPAEAVGMTPSLHHGLLRILSWRLDRAHHAFPEDNRLRLAWRLLQSFACPGRIGPRHWRRTLVTMIAFSLLFTPVGLIRARYPQILVGPRFRAALRRYGAATSA
jgi:glycosyltransferase involved in cell wall biosynthesis